MKSDDNQVSSNQSSETFNKETNIYVGDAGCDKDSGLSGREKWQVFLIVFWVVIAMCAIAAIGGLATYLLMNRRAFLLGTHEVLSWPL